MAVVMSEEEAEAVVLALGPQLEWRKFQHPFEAGRFHWIGRIKDKAEDEYYIDPPEFSGTALFMANAVADGPFANEMFATLDLAKSACERHHTTAKWE